MLSVVQQNILSLFNLVKIMQFKSTLRMYQEIISENNLNLNCNEDSLNEDIQSINRAIQLYDLEIVESIDELTSEKVLILINTGDNYITLKSKFYDDHTRQVFARIIKECVSSEKGNVSETHCLNLSSQIGMSKTAAQTSLDKLISDKWLVLMNGSVSLGMRSVVELEQSIKNLYPEEVKNCSFCKLLIVQGYICNSCNARYHYACVKKYYSQSKSTCICPNCKEAWNDLSESQLILTGENNERDAENCSSSYIPSKKRKKN